MVAVFLSALACSDALQSLAMLAQVTFLCLSFGNHAQQNFKIESTLLDKRMSRFQVQPSLALSLVVAEMHFCCSVFVSFAATYFSSFTSTTL